MFVIYFSKLFVYLFMSHCFKIRMYISTKDATFLLRKYPR